MFNEESGDAYETPSRLVPIRDGPVLPDAESGASVLADHHRHRLGQGVAQMVDRAMAGPDAVRRFFGDLLALKVEGSEERGGSDFRASLTRRHPLEAHLWRAFGQQGAEAHLFLFLHYCTNISPDTSG